MFGCLPKTNKVILWYNKCGLLAFWCFSICAKEQGSRGQVPHLTLGLWQMLSIKRRFSVFPKHLPGVGAFGKGDASYCVTSFSAARGFRKLTLISNDSKLFALNCAACWNALPDQVVLHFKDNDTFSDKGLCSLVEGQWYMLQSHVQLHQGRVRFHNFESRPKCFCKVLL